MLVDPKMRGRLLALMTSSLLVLVATFGVLHQFEHDSAHMAEGCAVCTTVRAPQLTASPALPPTPVVFSTAVARDSAGPVAHLASRSVRSIRGPPLA